MTHTKKPSPDTGKVSAELTEGASWSRNVRGFFLCYNKIYELMNDRNTCQFV